jgi:hypothetical protein
VDHVVLYHFGTAADIDAAALASPARVYRWAGTDRRGEHRAGCITLGRQSSVATLAAARFRAGWRELTVVAGDGPVPPARGEEAVARIDRTAPKGKRIWWAEG